MADVRQDVRLYYEDTDITDQVDIIDCVCLDVASDGCDCLTLTLDHAEEWFRWQPQRNDRLRVTRGGWDSKTLYLNTITPENGRYRILATGYRCAPRIRRWQWWENTGFSSVMGALAGEMGMGFSQYGVGGGSYEYLLRENETAASFAHRLSALEGAALKVMDGRFVCIGIAWAQSIPAAHKMHLETDQMDSRYVDNRAARWSSVTIRSPFAEGTASAAGGGGSVLITDIPVCDPAQAVRWARGLLLTHNRETESLRVEMDFNPGYTAMARVDVESRTDAAGAWLLREVEHDLLNGRTRAWMLRCVTGV